MTSLNGFTGPAPMVRAPLSTGVGDRIGGLDGLRGLAVLVVILFHSYETFGGPTNAGPAIARSGWTGVDLFFVISGFLITRILRRTTDHPRYWKTFAIRRALRILPLYFLVVTPIIVIRLSAGVTGGAPVWAYLFFISNFWTATASATLALDVTWSLAVEEQFYLLWPFAVRYFRGHRLAVFCTLLVVAAPVIRYLVHDPGSHISYMWTPARMDSLAWGALAAMALEMHSQRLIKAAAWIAPLGLTATVTWLWVGGDVRSDLSWVVVGFTLLPLSVAALILAFASDRLVQLRDLLGWAPIVYVGKVSFGAYLLHGPIVSVLGQTRLSGQPAVGTLIVIALTLGLATMTWRVFESPIAAKKHTLAPY